MSGNTLEVFSKGHEVGSINNFENFYFILPSDIKNGDTVLKVTGGQPTVFATKANIGIAVEAGCPLDVNDQVTLINNEKGIQNKEGKELVKNTDYIQINISEKKLKWYEGMTLKGMQGVSLEYDFELSNDSKNIYAKVVDVPEEPAPDPMPAPIAPAPSPEPEPTGIGARVRPQTKAIVESRTATLAALNSGADLVAGHAMLNAMAGASGTRGLAAGDSRTGVAVSPFAAVSGGTQRLESGSHVDVSGVSAVVGIAARKKLELVDLTAGVFFEFGSSRFSTHNSFSSGDVDGKGHATYTGAGILARLDVTDSILKGLYLEGSFRFGGMQNDWKTDDLRDAVTGRRASFDLYSPYHGAHAGIGYIWEVSEAFKLDFYTKWLWTHLYGDDTHVALDPYKFDDIDSHRLRAGVRADWAVSEQFGFYAGAAYEREFDSKARATAYGMDTPSPTVKGDTGVFDVGFSFKPTSLPDFKMELGATATAGKRHGISGNLMLKYEF